MTELRQHTRGTLFRRVFTLGNDWLGSSFDEVIFTIRKTRPNASIDDDGDAAVVAQASLTGGEITFSGAVGTIVIGAPATKDWPTGTLVWDLKGRAVGLPENVYPIDDGEIRVRHDITRSMP